MNIKDFVSQHLLKPADAIRLRKKFMGMVDHYVVYAGVINGNHRFIANFDTGVNFVSDLELNKFARILEPQEIERFQGDELGRLNALQRAVNAIGKKYKLFTSNCEHFKNWVQNGEWNSVQVDKFTNAGMIGAGALGIYALSTKNRNLAMIAMILLLTCLVISFINENKKIESKQLR